MLETGSLFTRYKNTFSKWMNKDLDVIFVGHAQSRNILTLNTSPAFKSHYLGQEMCQCLTGFPTSYINNIFPLFLWRLSDSEQSVLLSGCLIHAGPKMTLFSGEWQSLLCGNWVDFAGSSQMFDSSAPILCHVLNVVRAAWCMPVNKKRQTKTNSGPRPKQLYRVFFILGQ